MHTIKKLLLSASVTALAAAGVAPSAQAQFAVIDWTAIVYQIQQLEAAAQQLQSLQSQLTQAQQLYGSLNKLTNMGDIAGLLNNPAIRKALPPDFNAVEGLLTGNGSGASGSSAQTFKDANAVYQTPGNDFYAGELKQRANQNAGTQSLAQQMYDAATARIDGIDQLRQQIASSGDPKTTMDLQARLQSETAFMQADTVRMQALRMVQQAQLDVAKQRQDEQWRQRLDTLGSTSTSTN